MHWRQQLQRLLPLPLPLQERLHRWLPPPLPLLQRQPLRRSLLQGWGEA